MGPTLDTLELAKKLISIDSASQRSNVEIADFVQGVLEHSGFEVERLGYTDTHGELKINLVAKKGSGPGGFGIFCHCDTVPPGGGEWEAFTPVIKKRCLIGRFCC